MRFSRSLYLYLTLAFVGAYLASQTAGAVVAVPIAVPTESAAALEYHFVSNSFYVGDQILSLLFPLILLLTRWGSRFHETLVRFTGGRKRCLAIHANYRKVFEIIRYAVTLQYRFDNRKGTMRSFYNQ